MAQENSLIMKSLNLDTTYSRCLMMSLALNVSSFFYLSVQWIATKDIAVLPMGHHSFIDSVIHFCPIAFLIYGTLFPVFIIFCFFCDRQRLFTLFKIIAVAQIICYPIFFFFPYQSIHRFWVYLSKYCPFVEAI